MAQNGNTRSMECASDVDGGLIGSGSSSSRGRGRALLFRHDRYAVVTLAHNVGTDV